MWKSVDSRPGVWNYSTLRHRQLGGAADGRERPAKRCDLSSGAGDDRERNPDEQRKSPAAERQAGLNETIRERVQGVTAVTQVFIR